MELYFEFWSHIQETVMIAIDQEFVFLAILAAFVFIRAYRVLKVYSMTLKLSKRGRLAKNYG